MSTPSPSSQSSSPLLIRAFRGERSSRPPLWLMRQAGRYLPEYLALRKRYTMLQAMQTPDIAAEITLQPIRRFGFDGAIIFADILTPLIGMGIQLDFIEGEGPKIFNPVTSMADVEALIVPSPEENVAYTLRAIELCTHELRHSNTPLLGFSGAPFTLSTYLIGKGSTDGSRVKSFMLSEPEAWHALQRKLVRLVSEYLIAQVSSGAAAVQLFDSWVGSLGPEEFAHFAAPYLTEIISSVRKATGVPVIYFATGAAGLYPFYRSLGADLYGVDWRMSLTAASKMIGESFPLQGNLDPIVLAGPIEYLTKSVSRILDEGRSLPAHIFNLGHGILPHTPIGNVERLVEIVRAHSSP